MNNPTTLERPTSPVSRSLLSGGLTDAQLLKRFLGQRDEAAFELLVWRHGPMVLRVATRVLRDLHRAEDVFQASFFTLATKAKAIGKQESVSSWLYKVAYRLALRARAKFAKPTYGESSFIETLADPSSRHPGDDLAWRELGTVLDAEIQRLPEKLKAPFVLCYLQGKTNEEAAEELGCPKGTVLSRLSRARERLRNRLSRKGLVLSAGVLALLVGPNGWASAADSSVLVEKTMSTASGLIQKKAAAEVVSPSILDLMNGLRKSQVGFNRKTNVMVLLLVTLIGTAASLWGYQAQPAGCSRNSQQNTSQTNISTSNATTAGSTKCGSTP